MENSSASAWAPLLLQRPLVTNAYTEFNACFIHASGANLSDYAITVTANGKSLGTTKLEEGMYYVVEDVNNAFQTIIYGISATSLGDTFVVSITKTTVENPRTYSITTSPATYLYASQSTSQAKLARAMYNDYLKAKAAARI